MKVRYLFIIALLAFVKSDGQSIFSFSGSNTSSGISYNFFSPLVSGNNTFSNSIVNSGPVQLLADTAAVLDTTILQYDLDSIPPQLVLYNTPCKFYIKSDSLNRINRLIKGNSYSVTLGSPLGIFQIDRLNMVQYTTASDTFDFEVKFALITATNDTVRSKESIHFKIVPLLSNESSVFGVAGQPQLPDPQDREWRVQTIDSSSSITNSFNHIPNQHLKRVSYSGVQVVLEKNSTANQLYLLDKATNIDTLNLYAETLIIRDGFTFYGTTINIYAKELIFEDVNGKQSYLSTTAYTPPLPSGTPATGQKGGDIYLHVNKFSSNPGLRFFLNGGDGDTSAVPNGAIGAGGNGGNIYANIDVNSFIVQDGGYSGRKSYQAGVAYKGSKGSFTQTDNQSEWLNPKFFSIAINYYKEGFYAGVTTPVAVKIQEYSDLIASYKADSSLYKIDTTIIVQLQQITDIADKVVYNINNDLDYFGNPIGWVPMLSFEVTLAAYKNEVNHALNILFLDKLIQNSNNALSKRVEGLKQLKLETQTVVQDNVSQYVNLSYVVIPDEQAQIQDNLAKIDLLNQQMKALDDELNRRAASKYRKRRTWKWIGVASNVLKMIPSPYTQAASKAISFAAKLSGKNARTGFKEGKELSDKITSIITPFINGAFTGDISNLASNLNGGVNGIFTDIGSMQNLQDVKNIFNKSKELFNQNKALAKNVFDKMKSAVDLYNNLIKVPNTQVGAIKGELMSNEPRLALITAQLTSLQENQQKLTQQLETATQQMLTSKDNVFEGLTAISNFNTVLFDQASAIDHKLSVLSSNMRRKAFERLKKYHYFLAKAYEYRTLQPYPTAFDATNLILRIDTLVYSGRTTLTQSDYTALYAVYNDEIQQIAEDMFTYYNANQPASTIHATYAIKKEDINTLNQNNPITLNLVQTGLFPPSSEDIRIVSLKVLKIRTSVDSGTKNGSFNYIDLKFDYPNFSQIKKKGVIYNFNNYNLNTEYPINWTGRYDFLTNSISSSQLSGSANSLLWSLLVGTPGNPTSTTDFVLYSRPSAWADIRLTKEQITDGSAIAKIDSVYLDVEYDYLTRPSNIVNVELNTNNKWFAPTFNINTVDKFNRKSGIGNTHRSFALSSGNYVMAEAPQTYGRYTFQKWVDRFGNNLVPTSSVDVSGGNKIKFSLATDRSFKAQYQFTGAILKIPDTVYLDQSLQYSLTIQNIGTGSLNWNLDSNSSWIRYAGSTTGINDTVINLTFDQNPDMLSKRVGVLDVSSDETESFHNYIYFVQGKRNTALQYVFLGNGNWSNPANWSNQTVPPTNILYSAQVTVDPIVDGECVLDVPVNFLSGSSLKVKQGKKFKVSGNVTIRGL